MSFLSHFLFTICTNISTFYADFRYVARTFHKLEAQENMHIIMDMILGTYPLFIYSRALQGQF